MSTETNCESSKRSLAEAALAVREKAYAPYSGYAVGAAVLADDGRIHVGCNVENSSYGVCLCAERGAVAQAIASGARKVRAVAVATASRPPAPPCGICLQTLAELGEPGLSVLLINPDGDERWFGLAELLPHGFGASDLVRD